MELYEEAQGASTKRDFNYRISISYREARESVYWVRILEKLYDDDKFKVEFERFKNEATELKKIFSSIKISTNK